MTDIKKLALELGYEVIEDAVLLPLGEMHGWEYGLSIEGEKLRVYAKDEEIKYGKDISCYTAHSLIKTLELGEREFLMQRKDSEIKNKKVGLLYAFKNPKLQLDSSIKTEILRGAAVIIPEGHEILEREIIELQDKISEAKEISSIPGYENILKNLNKELCELANAYFSLEPEKIRINEITIEGDFDCAGDEMRGGMLVVKGDVVCAGRWMKRGSLVVKGDVEHAGREMRGGMLVVNGDVKYAGWRMKGGNLVVSGDVVYAGDEMRGGMLVVNGGVGYAGRWMEGGNLVVKGGVGSAGWWMKGGDLVVKGDVYDAGYEMKGGTLVVKGDVKCCAGNWMEGGRIAIYGTVDRIYDIHGGNIYIDFDKNPGHVGRKGVRPIEEFDGGLDERH
jgi:formylmethanofuran dehydrogenase subunit C